VSCEGLYCPFGADHRAWLLHSSAATTEPGGILLQELSVRKYGTFETELPPRSPRKKLVGAIVCVLIILGPVVSLVLGLIVGGSLGSRVHILRLGGALRAVGLSPSCSRSAFFDMSSVKHPSSFLHPQRYTTRTLVPRNRAPGVHSWMFSTVDISASVTGEFKCVGGVLLSNGKVVFVPCDADSVGIFDPATDAFSVVDISAKVYRNHKYFGGVLAPSGIIIFVPWYADQVGIFDPASSAFSVVDISAMVTGAKYVGGVLAPNGMIVFVPW
jgi:hypothetical protein